MHRNSDPKKTNSDRKRTTATATVVDLFCGIGGLSHGFSLEGFNIAAGIDCDASCKFAFEANNGAVFLSRGVESISKDEINDLFGTAETKILVGCAPCQPYSLYNNKIDKDSLVANDSRWSLLYSFAELIDRSNPEIISMENVPQLLRFNGGKVFRDFVSYLEKKDFSVTWSIVDAKEYGVPQRRKRLVLLASRLGKLSLIAPTVVDRRYMTVQEAIGHLPPVDGGPAHPEDSIHRARKLSSLNLKRIQATPQGGYWRDWDESLKLDCHKKESGKSFRSVYGRMKWEDVSTTITTYCIGLGNGRFGHPEQDRAITVREAALLQSFPESYKFCDPQKPLAIQTMARHIGNAVPVMLARAIAKSIKKHLEQEPLETN